MKYARDDFEVFVADGTNLFPPTTTVTCVHCGEMGMHANSLSDELVREAAIDNVTHAPNCALLKAANVAADRVRK